MNIKLLKNSLIEWIKNYISRSSLLKKNSPLAKEGIVILVVIVLLPWPCHFLLVALGSSLTPLKTPRIVLEQVEDVFDLTVLLWMEEEEMLGWR